MAAFTVNLKIDQGATFSQPFTWKTGTPAAPVDLTGCSARMQIRSKRVNAAVLLELTTINGGIVLGATAGTVILNLSAVQTAAIVWISAVYDLQIVFSDSTVRRLVSGTVTVSPEVTRA